MSYVFNGLLLCFATVMSGYFSYAQTFFIDTVFIEGNRLTGSDFIGRYLPITKGDTLRKENIPAAQAKIENALMNTNFYLSAKTDFHMNNIGGLNMKVFVREKPFLKTPRPYVRIGDRNAYEWRKQGLGAERLNWGIKTTLFPFRNQDDKITIALQSGYTQGGIVTYTRPFINRKENTGFEVFVSYLEPKEIWFITKEDQLRFYPRFKERPISQLSAGVALTTQRSPYWSERWELEYRGIQVEKRFSENGFNDSFFLSGRKQNEFYVRHILNFDNTDNRFYPLEGIQFRNELFIGQLNGDTSSSEIVRETIQLSVSKRMAKKISVSGFFKGSLSNRPKPFFPYNNYKAFGYADYVRGYEPYVVDGHAFLSAKFNFKFIILHKHPLNLPKLPFKVPLGIYWNLYSDWGRVFSDLSPDNTFRNTLINKNLFGYGTGLDMLISNDKVLRLEYTFNIHGDGVYIAHFRKAF